MIYEKAKKKINENIRHVWSNIIWNIRYLLLHFTIILILKSNFDLLFRSIIWNVNKRRFTTCSFSQLILPQ